MNLQSVFQRALRTSSLVQGARAGFAFTYPCPRNLREIIKMTLFERETKDRVKDIWMEYHKSRPNNVSYVLSKKEFLQFSQK